LIENDEHGNKYYKNKEGKAINNRKNKKYVEVEKTSIRA
jgi:hypothetical protein